MNTIPMKNKIYMISALLAVLFLAGLPKINAQPADTTTLTHHKQTTLSSDFLNNSEKDLTFRSKETFNEKQIKPWFSEPYPNPVQQDVTLDFRLPEEHNIAEIKLMDLTGKTIRTIPLQPSNNKVKINLSTLNRGMYFLAVYYKGNLIKSNALVVGLNH